MIDLIFVILTVCFGLAWGYYQGMIMTQYTDKMNTGQIGIGSAMGIRSHKLFCYYHKLSFLVFGIYTLMLISLIFIKPFILIILGSGLLAWQLAENGYNYSRYQKCFANYENLLGVKPIRGYKVYILHTLRIGISLLLITAGIL